MKHLIWVLLLLGCGAPQHSAVEEDTLNNDDKIRLNIWSDKYQVQRLRNVIAKIGKSVDIEVQTELEDEDGNRFTMTKMVIVALANDKIIGDELKRWERELSHFDIEAYGEVDDHVFVYEEGMSRGLEVRLIEANSARIKARIARFEKALVSEIE